MQLKVICSAASICLILLSGIGPAHALGGAEEDELGIGGLCLLQNLAKARAIVAALKAENVSAKIDSEEGGDGCVNAVRLDVPVGLEAWTSKFLEKRKVPFELPMASAGGSGIHKSRIKRSSFYSVKITPSNLEESSHAIACGLKERLTKFFENVNVVEGCGKSVSSEGLCFSFWIGGHLSDSKGLTPAILQGNVDSHYWFTSREEMTVSYYENYPAETGQLKDVYRIDLMTISSKFARAPKTTPPPPNRYRYLSDAFSVDDDAVDQLIAARMEKILLNQKLTCKAVAE